jgi:hypothetical protein
MNTCQIILEMYGEHSVDKSECLRYYVGAALELQSRLGWYVPPSVQFNQTANVVLI